MMERKRRLYFKKQKKEGVQKLETIERHFEQQETSKEEIISEFSSQELEQMLIQSNKNNPIEVVSILLCATNSVTGVTQYNHGVLTKLEKESVRMSKNNSSMLRLIKVTGSSNELDSHIPTEQSLSYNTPKDKHPNGAAKDRSQLLTRMRTSDEKQANVFNYNYSSTQPKGVVDPF